MNDLVLKEFFEDYSRMTLDQLGDKYGNDKYYEALDPVQAFGYLKKNNMLDLMIERDPLDNRHFFILFPRGSAYEFYGLFNGAPASVKTFPTLEGGVKHKVESMINYLFSSLTRK